MKHVCAFSIIATRYKYSCSNQKVFKVIEVSFMLAVSACTIVVGEFVVICERYLMV